MENEKVVHLVKLGSGKEILLHDPKIKHKNLAMRAAAVQGKDNAILFSGLMTDELVKILLFKIRDTAPGAKEPTPWESIPPVPAKDREDLDNILSMAEYGQLSQVIQTLIGGDDAAGKPQVEQMLSGSRSPG